MTKSKSSHDVNRLPSVASPPWLASWSITWRTLLISSCLWSAFGIGMVFYWCGFTSSGVVPCVLVILPHLLLLWLAKVESVRQLTWLALTVSIFVGACGSYEYGRFLIVRLSGMSNLVFTQAPSFQAVAVLLILGTTALFRKPTPPPKRDNARPS